MAIQPLQIKRAAAVLKWPTNQYSFCSYSEKHAMGFFDIVFLLFTLRYPKYVFESDFGCCKVSAKFYK